jgi:leader peptidase (prepilin peptidase)/N-methyltransferase
VYLAAVTPWLAAVDIRQHRLPNPLVLPGIGVGLLSCAGEWVATGRIPLVPLVAGTAYAGFLLILNLIGGMGMGDVKLAAALGLASWDVSVTVLSPVVAFFLGGVVSVALLIRGRRGHRIAFGPFLLGGFWAAIALQALAGT